MPAEAVSSLEFRRAFEACSESDRWKIAWAVEEIEQDPSWRAGSRLIAPADSPFAGFLLDLSVEGYLIVYRVVDSGAVVELWYLHDVPRPRKGERSRMPGPVPMM
jgi:hypothetical protein